MTDTTLDKVTALVATATGKVNDGNQTGYELD